MKVSKITKKDNEITIDLTDIKIKAFEIDLTKMTKECLVYDVVSKFIDLTKEDNDVFRAYITTNNIVKTIIVNKTTNQIFIDNNKVSLYDFLHFVYRKDPLDILERYAHLNRNDFVDRIEFENGLTIIKNEEEKWIVI